jgi:hypothetical protein
MNWHLIVDLILFSEMGLAINWIFGFCLGLMIPITMVNCLFLFCLFLFLFFSHFGV